MMPNRGKGLSKISKPCCFPGFPKAGYNALW